MWYDTRLLIIDEISFASPQVIAKIDTNLRTLLSRQGKRFKGMNVAFSGDLFQLKAIKQDSIIDNPCIQFDHWVNCYIELHGLHRFKDDPKWGKLLGRFQRGEPTFDDYIEINKRVVNEATGRVLHDDDHHETPLPDDIKYATNRNAEREVVNAAVFKQHCLESAKINAGIATDSIVILSDHLVVKTGKSTRPLVNRTLFWEGCGKGQHESLRQNI